MATFSYEPFFFFLSRKMVQQCGDFAIYFQKQKGLWKKKTALIYIHQFRRDNDLLVGSMINFFWTYSQHCRYFRLQNLEAFNFCQAIVLEKIESYVSLIGLKFIPKKLWIMSIILLKIQIHSVWWPSLKDKQLFLFITTLMVSSYSDIFSISFH